MTSYRCESGACPEITYNGDTVTIVETTNPEQVVVTPAAKWDAYLDTVRAQERARIAEMFRKRGDWHWNRGRRQASGQCHVDADMIERGDYLAAGDE